MGKIIKQKLTREQIEDKIFITGGIGDFIALESFFTDGMRRNLRQIYYATNKESFLREIVPSLKPYSHIQQFGVWNDFSNFWCFYSKTGCLKKMKAINIDPDIGLMESEDWSIEKIFPKITSGSLKYNNSSFLNEHRDIAGFNLPKDYYCICPFSSDKNDPARDFSVKDWKFTINFLKKIKMEGVVLNYGDDIVPDGFIDLSNKTTFMESVQILKKAQGAFMINSALSVVAAKIFNYPNLLIKSTSGHCYSNKHIYYAPQKQFQFLKPKIIF